jgi:hypothetical protein
MASPPLAGLLFEVGPLYLLYLVLGLAALQGALVILMWNTAGYTCMVPQKTAADSADE